MNPGYPPYPSSQMPGGQYPLYPTTTSQTPSGMPSPYPSQPGFNSGYPPQSAGYPPQSGGYPPQSGGYPPQPGYPSQPGYPPSSTPSYPPAGGHPPQTGYAPTYPYTGNQQQPAASPFPPQPAPAAYPQQTTTYPPSAGYPGQTPSPFVNPSAAQVCPAKPPSSTYPSQNYSPAGGYSAHSAVGQYQEQLSPTVRPANPFDARQDAEILRKAMKGFGTDEKAIIAVLSKRSNRQRLEIATQFKAMYGKDLISDLKSELSGKLEQLVVAMMTPLPEYLAEEIYHAIEGVGTNEETLVEILCTASNAEIYAIRDAYQRLYCRSLENDLSSDTSGHFRRLLISVVQGRRSENHMVDEAAAARDAQALMSAGVLMLGTDESTFNAILCTRSYPQLRRVFMEYQKISGHTLEQAVRNEFSGDIKAGLLAIVHCVEDKAGFFAERLRDSVACAGTKDRQLIRVVVSRSEIDMQNIKRAYQQRYGKSVEQDISDDTSGDYKKMLLALVSGY